MAGLLCLPLVFIFEMHSVYSAADISSLNCSFEEFCRWHSEGGFVNWSLRTKNETPEIGAPPNVDKFLVAEYADNSTNGSEQWALLWSDNAIVSVNEDFWISFYHCTLENAVLQLEVKIKDSVTYELEPSITFNSGQWEKEERELFDSDEDDNVGVTFQVIIKAILREPKSSVAISQFSVFEKPKTRSSLGTTLHSMTTTISKLRITSPLSKRIPSDDVANEHSTTQILTETSTLTTQISAEDNSTPYPWLYIIVTFLCLAAGCSIIALFKHSRKVPRSDFFNKGIYSI